MGMSLGNSGAGGRRGRGGRAARRAQAGLMSEINVTPFVDVMLVLLIVFMVAAPLLTVGVPIDLPETQARELNTQSKPVSISVDAQGGIFLGEEAIALADIVERVNIETGNVTDERIYVRGDSTADYGAVMRVMGVLSAAGYSQIGLVTAQEQVQ